MARELTRREATMSRMRIAAATALLAVGLTGCGAVDGLELNGRLFDWMGVSESAQKANAREPKLTERTGLVVPPDMNRLPEPGSGGSGEPDIAAQLNDPDRKRQMAEAERARLHKQYCSGELTWKNRAFDKNAGAPVSPYGPCTFVGQVLKQ
jgi:hypothetical protein